MPSPKEKSSGKKPQPSAKPRRGATPKRMRKRGAGDVIDKARAQFRDAAPSESAEEYGDEQIERCASKAAGRTVYAARDVGSRIKDRASEKLRSRRANTPVRKTPDRQADATPGQGSLGSEDGATPVQRPDIRQRPKPESEDAVKTKEHYIHAQTGENADTVREKPQRRPAVGKAEVVYRQENTAPGNVPAYTETPAYRSGKARARAVAQNQIKTREMYRRSSQQIVADMDKSAIKTAEKGTVKTASKGAVKTVNASVKTTERTAKTADMATHATNAAVRTAQKTAENAARKARAASRTAMRVAKDAVKATASAIKAIIAALKELVTAIAAGGWIAVVVIAGIALVGLLLCTAFGVFMADETEDGSKPMSEAVYQIDAEFRGEIDAHIAELSVGEYDEVVVDYMGDIDGDSAYVNNWNDVLATYAVLLTTDESNAMDAITVTPEKVARLRSIFNEMNAVEYDTEVIEEEIPPDPDAPRPTPAPNEDPPEPETKIVLYIYITVNSLDYRAAADRYRMTDKQREVLDEMMSAEFAMLFAEIAGVDVLGGADLTAIVSGLPTSGKGAEVVKAALTKLGSLYVWSAKGDSKFDCSGFAYWSIKQVDPSLGDRMYTNAAGQAKYCYDRGLTVGESELQAGDLVFWQNLRCKGCHRWQEVHHVGIYIGSGKVVEASSSKGRVVIRDLWSSTNYPLYMYSRPY